MSNIVVWTIVDMIHLKKRLLIFYKFLARNFLFYKSHYSAPGSLPVYNYLDGCSILNKDVTRFAMNPKASRGKKFLAVLMTVFSFYFFTESVSSLPGLPSSGRSPDLSGSSGGRQAKVLSKGKFLVASREIKDPRFAETVILILDYSAEGSIGLVINRRTDVKLSTLLPTIKALKHLPDTAYVGGPVNEGSVFLLVRDQAHHPELLRVLEDVYVSSSLSVFDKVLRDKGLRESFRAYVGYAGWAAGQLDREVSKGQWHVLQADAGTVFNKKPSGVWRELIARATAQWVKNVCKEKISIAGTA